MPRISGPEISAKALQLAQPLAEQYPTLKPKKGSGRLKFEPTRKKDGLALALFVEKLRWELEVRVLELVKKNHLKDANKVLAHAAGALWGFGFISEDQSLAV